MSTRLRRPGESSRAGEPALARLIGTEATGPNGSMVVGWTSAVHDALTVRSTAVKPSTWSIHRAPRSVSISPPDNHSAVRGWGSVHDPPTNHDRWRGSIGGRII